mgnify:CR=1 FL=1
MQKASGRISIVSSLFLGVLFSFAANAAEDPCQALGKVLNDRMQLIQAVQAYKDKKPTADEACTAFTRLAKFNESAVSAVERDGAWCRAPDDLSGTLKSQQAEINKARQLSCKAAADMKKAQKNGGSTPKPFGGADGVLGGEMKLPQGAL